MDLVELLKRPEGKTLEFKRELSTPDGALKTFVAFANTAGGTLLTGVEDKSGHVRGVAQPLDLEEALAETAALLVLKKQVQAIWGDGDDTTDRRWTFTLDVQAVDVSEPITVERGKYVLSFAAGAGAPPGMVSFEDRGNYLVHWRHEPDGEWRLVADAPVSELPLPQPGQ